MLILLQQSQSDQKEKIMKQIVDRIIGNLNETISKIRVFAAQLKKRKPQGWENEKEEEEVLGYPNIDGSQFDGFFFLFFPSCRFIFLPPHFPPFHYSPPLSARDVCRGAANLIQQPELDSALLHAICWAPFVVYTTNSMNSGMFAWRWLLAARPEYVMSVMIELRDAWVWTIEVFFFFLFFFIFFFFPFSFFSFFPSLPFSFSNFTHRNVSASSQTWSAPPSPPLHHPKPRQCSIL